MGNNECTKLEMIIIGITGGTGSGKSTALRTAEGLGALALDCDKIYHELLARSDKLKTELSLRFRGVLSGGDIDRKKLGEIVFSDSSALADLNSITHKYVAEEVDRRIAEWELQGGSIAVIEAIALIESGRSQKCNVVIGVTAPKELKVKRIMDRDGLTREQAERRIDAQRPDSFYTENCDRILDCAYNDVEEFEEICKSFFSQFF